MQCSFQCVALLALCGVPSNSGGIKLDSVTIGTFTDPSYRGVLAIFPTSPMLHVCPQCMVQTCNHNCGILRSKSSAPCHNDHNVCMSYLHAEFLPYFPAVISTVAFCSKSSTQCHSMCIINIMMSYPHSMQSSRHKSTLHEVFSGIVSWLSLQSLSKYGIP